MICHPSCYINCLPWDWIADVFAICAVVRCRICAIKLWPNNMNIAGIACGVPWVCFVNFYLVSLIFVRLELFKLSHTLRICASKHFSRSLRLDCLQSGSCSEFAENTSGGVSAEIFRVFQFWSFQRSWSSFVLLYCKLALAVGLWNMQRKRQINVIFNVSWLHGSYCTFEILLLRGGGTVFLGKRVVLIFTFCELKTCSPHDCDKPVYTNRFMSVLVASCIVFVTVECRAAIAMTPPETTARDFTIEWRSCRILSYCCPEFMIHMILTVVLLLAKIKLHCLPVTVVLLRSSPVHFALSKTSYIFYCHLIVVRSLCQCSLCFVQTAVAEVRGQHAWLGSSRSQVTQVF